MEYLGLRGPELLVWAQDTGRLTAEWIGSMDSGQHCCELCIRKVSEQAREAAHAAFCAEPGLR